MIFAWQYLSNLGYPFNPSNRAAVVDWLLGFAVRLDYADNGIVAILKKRTVSSYECLAEQLTKAAESLASAVGADQSCGNEAKTGRTLDAQSEEFKSGILKLAKMFQLPSHADHILLFKAISILIEERLSQQTKVIAQKEKKSQSYEKGDVIPLSKVDLGFTISGNSRESIM
jgi:RLL motif-containing protein 1